MIKSKFLAVGVMSGTSMDGIDISLILSDGKKSYKHIKSKFYSYKKSTKTILSKLVDSFTVSKHSLALIGSAEESVTFEGKYYQYKNATIAPRPVQQPLPLWIGGSSNAAINRTGVLGSGWIGGITSPEDVNRVILGIKAKAEEVGRTIDDDHYGTSIGFRIGTPQDDAVVNSPFVKRTGIGENLDLNPLFAIGTSQDIIARIQQYIAAGASKFVMFPIASGEADMIDQTRRVVAEIKPAIEN